MTTEQQSKRGLREVYNANDQMQAQLASTLLHDAGIECMVEHETLNQVWGGVLGPSGGVSVLVHEERYEVARQVLIDGELIPADNLSNEDLVNGATLAPGKQGRKGAFQRMSLKKQLTYIILIILVILGLLLLYNYFLN